MGMGASADRPLDSLFELSFEDRVDHLAAELQLMTELGQKVEEGLTLEFEHWYETARSRPAAEDEEAWEWLAEDAGEAKWLVCDVYPQLVRGAILLMVFARAERWVGDLWCEVARRKGIAPPPKWGVTTDWLRKAGRAVSLEVTSVGGAAGSDVDNAWELRNVVAHHCASLEAWEQSGYARDPQRVREFVGDHDLLTETRAGTLGMAPEFCKWAAAALSRVFAGLGKELDGLFAMPPHPGPSPAEGVASGEEGSPPSS